MKVDAYVNNNQLKELLKNPYFVAYAPLPGNKIVGGMLHGLFFMKKRGTKEATDYV